MRPLPVLLRRCLDMRQLRQICQMSLRDLAEATGVRLHVLYCMEMGIAAKDTDALRVVWVLSQRTGLAYHFQDIRGLNVQWKRKR